MRQFFGAAIWFATIMLTLHLMRGGVRYDATVVFGPDCPIPAEWIDAAPCMVKNAVVQLSPNIFSSDYMSISKRGETYTFPSEPGPGWSWQSSRVATNTGRMALGGLVLVVGFAIGLMGMFGLSLRQLRKAF